MVALCIAAYYYSGFTFSVLCRYESSLSSLNVCERKHKDNDNDL